MNKTFLNALILSGVIFTGCATKKSVSTEKPILHGQEVSKPVLESSEMNSGTTVQKIAFKIGDDQVHYLVHQKPTAKVTMVNVHDDENTSVEAGLVNIEAQGGRLIELVHSGHRLVVFHVEGQRYSFDPNRVFSDAGIKATLEKHGSYSPAALDAIRAFSTQYLQYFALEKEPVIIALHNTMDGDFSIKSFEPHGQYGTAAVETYVSQKRNKFDFFYVTERNFFDFLKARDYNVTLQDNANAPDDGSLSVYFAHKGIPYLNIEAEIKHLDTQTEMVKVAREMVDTLVPRKK